MKKTLERKKAQIATPGNLDAGSRNLDAGSRNLDAGSQIIAAFGFSPGNKKKFIETLDVAIETIAKSGNGKDAVAGPTVLKRIVSEHGALNQMALGLYVNAAKIFHIAGEQAADDGEKDVANANYRQAFRFWGLALSLATTRIKLHELAHMHMWAAGSGTKAGMKREAAPHVAKVVKLASNVDGNDGTIKAICKYLVMLGYKAQAAEIYCARLMNKACKNPEKIAIDILAIDHELENIEVSLKVFNNVMAGLGKRIVTEAKKEGSKQIRHDLQTLKAIGMAWKAQKFREDIGFKDQEKVLSMLDVAGFARELKGKIGRHRETSWIARDLILMDPLIR